MTRRLGDERGQAAVLTVLFMTVLLGMTAIAIDVGAHAAARTDRISQARYAAPVAVNLTHPMLSGSGCPCFGEQTTLDLQKTGPGAFRLINLDGSRGGISPGTLGDWMDNGLDAW